MSSCSDARRRRLIAALGLASLGLRPAAAAEPAATANPLALDPASFERHDLDWRDASRDRAVPVRLYLPQGTPAAVPLVLFSHGIGGSRRGYSYLGAYLAAQGVAALHVQHVGSDRELWFGNPFKLVGRLQGAAREGEAVARVRDVRFALDSLLASDWAHRVDASRILAAGHSYGANTTLLLAGAQVARDGHLLELREPRLKAAVLISAPPFYGEARPSDILGGIRIPTLHITATDDVIQIPGYHSPAADRITVFDAVGSTSKALAVFQGGSHSVFTDRSGTGGVALNPKIKLATRELVVDFAAKVLDARPQAFAAWPERHRELLARWTLTPSS